MAAATTDVNTELWGLTVHKIEVPVKAAETIYAGTMVCKDASGYAVAGGHAATETFWGIAMKQVDNSAGLSAALEVEIAVPPLIFKMDFTTLATATTLDETDVGSACYIVDDQTLTLSTAQTAENACGVVEKYISATSAWVRV